MNPMDNETDLTIVIPAYNEQDRIVPTLTHTLAYLERQPFSIQLLVVSDGSKDQTAAVAASFKPKGRVRMDVLEYHPNRGKGYAVKYGMLRGSGRVIMFMDADYAVPMAACQKGLALIDAGYDIAIASRAIAGAQKNFRQNFMRELSAKIYTLIQNRYLGIAYPDTQCGFKLFTRSAAVDLFTQQKLDSVIFDPEILWLAKRGGYQVAQFPVQWTHVADSRIQYDSIGKSLYVFRELLRIRRLHAT
ncbi:MAG: glycosyltransferase family 2 protein [Desulfatitalea sp.]|nr:glycosyltransferase family 2 protein [Desulfatitalea sp.]